MDSLLSKPLLTVAICTFNRAKSLQLTLTTLEKTTCNINFKWECIVIDNNSSDDTSSVVEKFYRILPVRYVFEPLQGLSYARNRAIIEAHAPFIIFTDDDVDIQPGWIEAYAGIIRHYPEAAFMGGPILPAWQTPPPEWVLHFASTWLNGITVWCECGAETHSFDLQHDYLYGANFGFRIDALRKINGFHLELGRKGRNFTGGEDLEIIEKLVQQGYSGIYLSEALVRHRIEAIRWSSLFILKNSIGHGRTCCLRSPRLPRKWIGGLPLRLSMQVLFYVWHYIIGRLFNNPNQWLPNLCRLGWTLGEWHEVRRMKRQMNLRGKG